MKCRKKLPIKIYCDPISTVESKIEVNYKSFIFENFDF